MGTWTDPVDRADGYVVGQTVWNQLLGDTGNLAYLYENMTRFKYKTASQNFTSTTYADITATSGNLAFSVAASTSYRVVWDIHVSAIGTVGSGGLKLQLTGPSAPTAVQIFATYASQVTSVGSGAQLAAGLPSAIATSFSSDIFSVTALNTGSAPGISAGWARVEALIVNGSNAGTVTIQGAQSSAAGTTTISAGRAFCWQLGTA